MRSRLSLKMCWCGLFWTQPPAKRLPSVGNAPELFTPPVGNLALPLKQKIGVVNILWFEKVKMERNADKFGHDLRA